MLEALDDTGCRLEWILETHAHADHITAAQYIKARTGSSVGAGRGIVEVQATFRQVYNMSDFVADGGDFDALFDDGDVFRIGDVEVSVMSVPGHTSDSVAYLMDGMVFVGDTLFRPDFGSARCDFPGGDADLLYDSAQRLHALPDDTRLYLCHDYPREGNEPTVWITVGQSRQENIHLGSGSDRESFALARRTRDAELRMPALILPAVQINIRAGLLPDAEDNGVAYLRIPLNRSLSSAVEED